MTDIGSILAAIVSFAVTGLMGILLIPFLRRLRAGQTIRNVGPTWHKSKQGTPVMGGLMFIAGVLAALLTVGLTLLAAGSGSLIPASEKAKMAGGVLMALMFGFIGFMDDYIKVVKRRNLGLTVRQKLTLQILAGVIYLLVAYLAGDRATTMDVPFFAVQWHMGLFYWPLALFIIVGAVNSVNLTDGVDGLCGSVTFVAAIAFMLCAKVLGFSGFTILSAALAGGCLGFLVWNLHPAKIFMGDTGSLFLGGMVCAIAFGIRKPLLLVPIGVIYIVETLSDIIQIISFKTTGRRVFKMSPIHHHFELCGWSENRIVGVFSLITAICSIAAVVWTALDMGLI